MNIQDILVNQIGPVVIAGVVAILLATTKSFSNVAIDLVLKKKEEIEQNLGLAKHKEEIQTAKEVWNIVDEKYRITDKVENLMKSKADDFDALLLKKIPYLTKDQVTDIRQAIAGEVNKGKEKLLSDDTLKAQLIKEQQEKASVQLENEQLKSKIEQIKTI